MLPVVSVVIPTYKHAEHVLETLDSVFAQTFTGYEIVVVNDGSPDDTAERLRPLAEAGRIRYFEQPNAGQSSARNRGVAAAGGEFIAFLDDDDLWPPDKLGWQVEALRAHADWTAVAGEAGLIDADGTRHEPQLGTAGTRLLTLDAFFSGNQMKSPGQALVRRTALQAAGGLDAAIWGSDDWDLWMRLAAQGPVVMLDQCALYYRTHATNASHNVERMFWSGVHVVGKNLALVSRARRFELRGEALRDLYLYSGARVVNAAGGGSWKARWAAWKVLAYLSVRGLGNAELRRMIGRDVVPGFLQGAWRQLRSAGASGSMGA